VAIFVRCDCGQEFQTRDENAGRRARCPHCGRELVVPKPAGPLDEGDVWTAPAYAPGPPAPAPQTTSGKAIASLVLGICSLVFCLLAGIPAIIFGVLGLGDINRSRGMLGGRGMATAGIILGGLGSSVFPIAVMIGLLLPAVQAAREAARRIQCVNNIKQIGLAVLNYESAHSVFPAAAITDEQGKPLLSWRVAILPFLEEQALYNQFHLDEPWDSPHNKALIAQMPKTYACPSNAPDPSNTTYQIVVGPNTMFTGEREGLKIGKITDGTSNTILVVEASQAVPWTAPEELSQNTVTPTSGAGSKHPGGFNTLFADGSVRFLKKTMSPVVFNSLLTTSGGEVISADSY
jgi:prepilin-type processing-associated H-X9-DG protein